MKHEQAIDKAIEAAMDAFNEVRKIIPNCHRVTFEAVKYCSHGKRIDGFIHIGQVCESYSSPEKLKEIINQYIRPADKDPILFRKFQ